MQVDEGSGSYWCTCSPPSWGPPAPGFGGSGRDPASRLQPVGQDPGSGMGLSCCCVVWRVWMHRDLTGESEKCNLSLSHENPSTTTTPAQGHKKTKGCCAGVSPISLLPWKSPGGHSHPREVMGMEGGTSCKDRGLGCAARVIPAQLLSKAGSSPQGHCTAGSIHWTGMSHAGPSVLTPPHTPRWMEMVSQSQAVLSHSMGLRRRGRKYLRAVKGMS